MGLQNVPPQWVSGHKRAGGAEVLPARPCCLVWLDHARCEWLSHGLWKGRDQRVVCSLCNLFRIKYETCYTSCILRVHTLRVSFVRGRWIESQIFMRGDDHRGNSSTMYKAAHSGNDFTHKIVRKHRTTRHFTHITCVHDACICACFLHLLFEPCFASEENDESATPWSYTAQLWTVL